MRVTTFNVRYASEEPGANRWSLREPRLLAAVRAADADVLGVQECVDVQLASLSAAFPRYGWSGEPRGGPDVSGQERCTIFWRQDRLQLLTSGTRWLSPTPELPVSVGWDAALPRIFTWVRLRGREESDHTPPWLIVNAHFDHVGKNARQHSARAIRAWCAEHRRETPSLRVVVMGDFNAPPGDPVHEILTEAPQGEPAASALQSAWSRVHTDEPQPGTFHGFTGQRDGACIDWAVVSPGVRVHAATVDTATYLDGYPSDHYPVSFEMT